VEKISNRDRKLCYSHLSMTVIRAPFKCCLGS